jgi:hypothetical protein
MKRNEILESLGFTVPEIKKNRLIIHSDIAAEADDQFAIVHHLLTPCSDVKGIIASHFEWRFSKFEPLKQYRWTSMMKSYEEGKKILSLMGIDDIPLCKGSKDFLAGQDDLPESEGADFIIEEAMREDDKPLYVALQSNLTDLAIAYKKEPRIAGRLTAIWIGGGTYPGGGEEANLRGDIEAARIVFASPIPLWQIPSNVYPTMELSFAELLHKVKPCGAIGAYLHEEMIAVNEWYGRITQQRYDFPHGESWSIGDTPTIAVLLQSKGLPCWHTEKAPIINDDYTYTPNPKGKEIRVYDWVDTRLTMNDFFAKLALCYGEKGI